MKNSRYSCKQLMLAASHDFLAKAGDSNCSTLPSEGELKACAFNLTRRRPGGLMAALRWITFALIVIFCTDFGHSVLVYDSLDEAGKAGSEAAKRLSDAWTNAPGNGEWRGRAKGMEYWGYICQCGCTKIDYAPTAPKQGIHPKYIAPGYHGQTPAITRAAGERECKCVLGQRWSVAGWFHSHPDSSFFSDDDAFVSNNNNLPGFVTRSGTLNGDVSERIDPVSDSVLRNRIPNLHGRERRNNAASMQNSTFRAQPPSRGNKAKPTPPNVEVSLAMQKRVKAKVSKPATGQAKSAGR